MLTSINTAELYSILDVTPAEQNIMLAGKHGIGKSEIIKNYFESKGKKVVTFFCSQAADPGDIIGLPRIDEETKRTFFALPWWFPVDNKPVVLFLDELNRARPEILQTVMDLTLNRKIAGVNLPAGSQIISAVNIGDEYQLTDLDPALMSRFNIYNFKPSPADWLLWAQNNNIDKNVISFITSNSKFLDPDNDKLGDGLEKTPDRRAWHRVSDILKAQPKINNTLKKILSGIIGASAASAFYTALQKSALVTAEDIIEDCDKCVNILTGYDLLSLSNLNSNICSLINTKFSSVVWWDGASAYTPEVKSVADNLTKYLEFLGSANGNREAFAHFVTEYESGTYANLNFLVSSYPQTLEKTINDYIISIATE